jgi:hypothetical protein
MFVTSTPIKAQDLTVGASFTRYVPYRGARTETVLAMEAKGSRVLVTTDAQAYLVAPTERLAWAA